MESRGKRLVRLARKVTENFGEATTSKCEEQVQNGAVNDATEPFEMFYDSDDSVRDQDYVPSDLDSDLELTGNDRANELPRNIHSASPSTNSEFFQVLINDIVLGAVQQAENREHSMKYTKKGEVRKRKLYTVSVNERKRQKLEKKRSKHHVQGKCTERCKRRCANMISTLRQEHINKQFWELDAFGRRNFMLNSCSRTSVKRRTAGENSRRNNSVQFYLTTQNGEKCRVCKVFFLCTLGYEPKNDRVLRNVLTKTDPAAITPATDKRRNRRASNKSTMGDLIDQHIEAFNPIISHYRREHAPNRRYLPSDLTIAAMYKDFTAKYAEGTVSYELYRKAVANKNISFVKLGHEECWLCECFELHKKTAQHDEASNQNDCNECQSWVIHRQRYRNAREEYTKDAENESGKFCVSADLQKVT